ncbi:CAP domain-containing protein [Variovorax ureilyticus]|uniref:CAP domain-containing protein n=1 Tax=Variovorax ureilyticus TaxID=1836198 RepID=UPI003D6657AA
MPHSNHDEDLQRDLKDLAELRELSKRLDDHEYRLDALASSIDATKRLLALKSKWHWHTGRYWPRFPDLSARPPSTRLLCRPTINSNFFNAPEGPATNMTKYMTTLPALALSALALTACGGGGGGGAAIVVGTSAVPAPAPSPAPSPAPAPAPSADPTGGDSTLVSSVPAPTYAPASEELAAFNFLNSERQRCGFGLLAQNAMLDVASNGHANYLMVNNATGHFQDNTKPAFTGTGPGDRATAAGYAWSVILDDLADTTGGGANVLTGRGVLAVRSLLSAPYHTISLVSPQLDIGLRILSSDTVGTTGTFGPRAISHFALGMAQGAYSQKPNSASVQTYPCEGTTGTAYQLTNESPNPIPGRDLTVSPVGQPIIVAVRPGQMVNITSATMVKKSDGSAVALRPALDFLNDPNHLVNATQAVIIPDAPLQPDTQYTVTIEGTNTLSTFNGTTFVSSGTNPAITYNTTGAFTNTFTFKTGS